MAGVAVDAVVVMGSGAQVRWLSEAVIILHRGRRPAVPARRCRQRCRARAPPGHRCDRPAGTSPSLTRRVRQRRRRRLCRTDDFAKDARSLRQPCRRHGAMAAVPPARISGRKHQRERRLPLCATRAGMVIRVACGLRTRRLSRSTIQKRATSAFNDEYCQSLRDRAPRRRRRGVRTVADTDHCTRPSR